ncbi:MAG TPA: gamma-glutamyl-gamma-aminobutyrate hydrolase family protein [Streptosporangiaceae bacterium]|nr:gamma-glutamyl-gamma-aminobutyrate hydrolase family protein [Streptosporangiaceae bacterium]
MRVIVIRHHAEDSPGFIADAFVARGAEVSVHMFPGEGELPALDNADHVVVLGAIPSINDSGAPSLWISQEMAWLRQADEAGVPVLGICFGAQALCVTFGGQVEAAPSKEIGWKLVESTDASLIPVGPWLEFHSDRCLPPAGATILATNEAGVQAFTVGRHLAVQFHPEVDSVQLAAWLEVGARAEIAAAGVDADELLARTAAEEPAAKQRAATLVDTALRLARPGYSSTAPPTVRK